ncbi:SAM-dependent methyltransferase [Kutzneria albida]|uniref:S-adenosyl-L-methionine-dependent methyltransferase n=1 Tax=Kutzneria albida DSM 43870 TaxID=1449976 RepID=W5WI88_9PSEU|nr:SAM-dependent methyltransferase [Kutzneria albida]AHI00573.1 hypothetical protein KALB_7215 [Kutzneria albida DSM 43870]
MTELTDVGSTALWVALGRARESVRADRLFSDPLARFFVEAAGMDRLPESELAEPAALVGDYFAIRTRFFDDCTEHACAEGCDQVVVLGAGLDARAFRLDLPTGARLFELDLPEVLAFKERVIQASGLVPSCERLVVPADLREDWLGPLLTAGFAPDRRTVWIAEGLLPYLTGADARALLTDVHSVSAIGSRIALEHDDPAVFEAPLMRRMTELSGVDLVNLVGDGVRDDPLPWLAQRGWRTSATNPAERAVAYQRPVPPVFDPEVEGSAARAGVGQQFVEGLLVRAVNP